MHKITKAVIPVAGLGTRFLPATKAVPKELLPIVDKPALQYVVEEAFHAGLSDIILITNPFKSLIEKYFTKTTPILQDSPRGLGHAILCAKEAVGTDWFVVLLPDMLMDSLPSCTAQMIDIWRGINKPIIAAAHAPREMVSQYGIIAIDKNAKIATDNLYKVTDLVEKPAPKDAPSDLFVAGRYLLPPSIFDYLKNVKPGSGGEIQLTDALLKLLKTDEMYAYEFSGVLHDTGDKLGYLKANMYYGMKRPELRDELRDYLKNFLIPTPKI